MPRIVSFVALVIILLVIAALFIQVMAGFIVPLFLAVLLVVIFRPMHQWIVLRSRGRQRLAAALTTLAILLIVLVPLSLILFEAGREAASMARRWDLPAVKQRLAQVRQRAGLEPPPADIQQSLQRVDDALDAGSDPERPSLDAAVARLEQVLADGERRSAEPPAWLASGDWSKSRGDVAQLRRTSRALAETPEENGEWSALQRSAREEYERVEADIVGGPLTAWLKHWANPSEEELTTLRERAKTWADSLAVGGAQYAGDVLPDFLIGIAVMIIGIYYFLADGPEMIATFMRLSPLDDHYEEELVREFATISRAVVVATLLSAVAQGLLAGIGYFTAGLASATLLTLLTMLFALVPFIGGTAVWAPCCLWLFLEGRVTAAVLLTLYSAVIVSMADNVIKPLVLRGQSNLHPLLALLSVLGGAKALGPIGIVVGPMAVAFLQALLKMLQVELRQLDAHPQPAIFGKKNPPAPTK